MTDKALFENLEETPGITLVRSILGVMKEPDKTQLTPENPNPRARAILLLIQASPLGRDSLPAVRAAAESLLMICMTSRQPWVVPLSISKEELADAALDFIVKLDPEIEGLGDQESCDKAIELMQADKGIGYYIAAMNSILELLLMVDRWIRLWTGMEKVVGGVDEFLSGAEG